MCYNEHMNMLVKKLTTFFLFLTITVVLAVASVYFDNTYLSKTLSTFIALCVSYLFFKILLEALISKEIKNSRSRYTFRKTTQILFLVVSFVVILRIWIINPQALMVAYGLIAAGVAIALQDLFRNFAGGITIFIAGQYQVGDRVEINGKFGDVIDIGIMYTTLLEMREWVAGDQVTGRISIIPNGAVLSGNINNYTKDHNFVWDEFALPITYESNWRDAMKIIEVVLKEKSDKLLDNAKKNFAKLEERYYVSTRNMEASVYLSLTDNWIQMNSRYIVDARSRRIVQAEIMRAILEKIEQRADITIASTTLSLVGPTKDEQQA